MKAWLIAGAAILVTSTAQADDCAAIIDQIERYQAGIVEYEKAIEEEGFVDESPEEMYHSATEQAAELLKALNHLRAERIEAERALDETGESERLRDVVYKLRTDERVLLRHIDRLNSDLGWLRTAVAMQREMEAKSHKLAAYIGLAEAMGCKPSQHSDLSPTRSREFLLPAPECSYQPVQPCGSK